MEKSEKKVVEYQLHKNVILGGFNDRMDIFWKFCDVNFIFEFKMMGLDCLLLRDICMEYHALPLRI